eukprot:scaffold12214_cov159-Amphora_coffeaeformis.AAC.4
MSFPSVSSLLRLSVWVASVHTLALAFAPHHHHSHAGVSQSSSALYHAPSEATATASFIDTELRRAAMKLHTREQAPKEGQAPTEKREPHVTTHEDYLHFLVDSQHVYQAFEDIVNAREELAAFRNTGLERVAPLETDIEYMTQEFNLKRPSVGKFGQAYAEHLRGIESIPEFVCHFYNWYFAHTAGGRMIGKQISALLLENKTLEFYKWEGDLNEIKARVKGTIEDLAASWSAEGRAECVDATAETFRYAGAINKYLAGHTE